MSDPGVLAVVVAHASGRWLSETLRAIAQQTYADIEVVVVTVGEVDVPAGLLPPERARGIVALPDRTGFSSAVMRGVEAAGGRPAFVWLLHDDVAPDADVLARLVERLGADPSVAAAGPKYMDWERPDVLQEVGGAIDRFAGRRSGLDVGEVDHGQYDDTEDVLFCSAACLLVRCEDLQAVGGLDPDGWPLYEDVDLCWRLRRAGRRVVVVPAVRARHVQALSRGVRRETGRGFGPLGLMVHAERGRLWLMLKNYSAVSLAVLLPQLVMLELFHAVAGLISREFWRVRSVITAWVRVAAGLGHIVERRRHAGHRAVEDQELLRLGGRRALTERRYERVAVFERAAQAVQAWLRRVGALAREPVVWAVALGVMASLITLRDVLFSGGFVLGELRPPPGIAGAVRSYVTRLRPAGFDRLAADSPGIVAFGALRTLLGGSAAAAQKVALVGPFLLAAAGAAKLGDRIGLGRGGRRWFAVLAMVNPFTIVLLRRGFVGPLLVWAISMWVAAAMLRPSGGLRTRERARRVARWALAWTAAVALHPPALIWFIALALTLAAARTEDGSTRDRVRLVGVGAAAAFIGTLPWSASWLTWPGPLFGSGTALVRDGTGLEGAAFGGGVAALIWVGVSLVATYAVGPTRTTLALGTLAAAAWVAGTVGFLPVGTALLAVGWTTLVLLAFVARRVRDELSRYNLGWRQALVIAIVGAVGAGWGLAVVQAVVGGTDARPMPLFASTPGEAGRVVWLASTGAGTFVHATSGFSQTMRAFPQPTSSAAGVVQGALEAARGNRTHRLGALLALADVSHVVTLDGPSARGLGRQADLTPAERLGATTIYRNEAWSGTAMLLDRAPRDVLGPRGLADIVRRVERVPATSRPDGSLQVRLGQNSSGVLYLAVGSSSGWKIGNERARPSAAGVWARSPGPQGEVVAQPPGAWWRVGYLLGALVVLAVLVVWLTGAYLATPEVSRPIEGIGLRAPTLPRLVGVLVLMVVTAGAWMGWRTSASAGPFLSAAWYCPPPGETWDAQIAVANPNEGAATYIIRPSLAAEPLDFGTLSPHGRTTVPVDGRTGAVVETYGRRVVAAAEVRRRGATTTSGCTQTASERVYFADGGRAATRAQPRLYETYVIHNPFRDLARVSFRFIAPDEVIAPPALQDVRVDAGSTVFVRPEEQFEPMPDLSVEVRVWQGRAVAARRLCIGIVCNEGGAEEIFFSTGVEPGLRGVLPRARTTGAQTALIAVNANDEPATVELSFVTPQGSLPSERLELAPQSRDAFDVAEVAPDIDNLVVRYAARLPVAVEALVAPADRNGVSLLPGLVPARRWAIAAAENRTLVVVNPGTRAVRVRIRRLGPGPEIRTLRVGPSRVATLEIPGDEPFGILAEADGGDITAVAVGGAGSLSGVPLR